MIQHLLMTILPLAVTGLFKTPASTNSIQPVNHQETVAGQVLTITYVKKPWYAGKNLIIRKMKASFQQYQSIPGLEEKMYILQQGVSRLGGIYRWKDLAAAQAWFNENWYAITEEKYGLRGIVDYYQLLSVTQVASTPPMEGKYIATLTDSNTTVSMQAAGLIRILQVQNNAGEQSAICLWENKAAARKALGNAHTGIRFFDAPLLLRTFQ